MEPLFGIMLLLAIAAGLTIFFMTLSYVTKILDRHDLKIKLCNCGKDIDTELDRIDSVYPVNRERTKWNICCQTHNMGCGRVVYGDTLLQAQRRWNEDEADEYVI
jgi:hypothetical protein